MLALSIKGKLAPRTQAVVWSCFDLDIDAPFVFSVRAARGMRNIPGGAAAPNMAAVFTSKTKLSVVLVMAQQTGAGAVRIKFAHPPLPQGGGGLALR